jgi:hypothetical protein
LMPVNPADRSLEFGPVVRGMAMVQIIAFGLGTAALVGYGIGAWRADRGRVEESGARPE